MANAAAGSQQDGLANLISTVQMTGPTDGKCMWHLGTVTGLDQTHRAAIAWIVANAIMDDRGGGSRAAATWRSAALAGSRLAGSDREMVAAFVTGVFGLPPRGKSKTHVVGHVAEWLWYLHARHALSLTRKVELLETPKFNVTEPGADGFIVYTDSSSGETIFRLWEIKQHVGGSPVSDTVTDAYGQLKTHATRYLAQLTSVHSAINGPVGDLCKQLVDFWIDSNSRAGVGVSVASATTPAPATCFSTMGNHFPGFTRAGQLEGLLLAVEDLEDLALEVRGYLWTAL